MSLLPPPVRPTLRLPPYFGADVLPPGEVDGDAGDEQASSRPPPARAAPPSTAERRNVRRSKREAATSAAASLSGRGVVLIGASLLLSGLHGSNRTSAASARRPVVCVPARYGNASRPSRPSCRIADRDAVDGVVMLAARLVVGKVVAALAIQPHEVQADLAERY